MRHKIVLDTNVLVAALRSKQGASYALVQRIGRKEVDLHLSVPLLFEYESVLKRKETGIQLTHQQIDSILDYLCLVSTHHEIHFMWRPFLKDASDDMVLELAVTSGARSIVTFNVKDFKGSEAFGVRSITPKECLSIIQND